MYSVVLATMLATSSNTPDCWKKYCCPPPRVYSCGGCYGCYGYSYYRPVAYVAYSCTGCRGGVPVVTYSCQGCLGGAVQYKPVAPPTSVPPPVKPQANPKPALPSPSTSSVPANQATVVFKAPLDIQISLGNLVIQRTNEEEVHITPALEDGKNYSYTFKAVRKVDETEMAITRKVEVKPGTTVVVDFPEFATVSTAAR